MNRHDDRERTVAGRRQEEHGDRLAVEALEAMQRRLDRKPGAMTLRRRTIEHVFGTLKHWMGATHFLMKRLPNVKTEMSLHVLAYNLKRAMQILGAVPLMKAMRA